MIYRKILKTKIVGSRETGDLRPAFSDSFVETYGKGINFVVHEYNETEGYCIVECWCSDNELLDLKERKSQKDLDNFGKDKSVISIEPNHPLSPKVLATISISGHSAPIDSVDPKTKTVVTKGKSLKYLKERKEKDTSGKDLDVYILDEG